MKSDIIKRIIPLGFPWQTMDPFLFCVYHLDFYPPGNEQAGPKASLEGRLIGQDFEIKDGWRMYHGDVVPGFPVHPHRGFETVTIVQQGLVDHADSLGAAGRYGGGDVQWLTTGAGVQHSEMFPLVHRDKDNTLELFQIWLNLPAKNKMVEPYFAMLWADLIPKIIHKDTCGNSTEIDVVAGTLQDRVAPAPPPDSWAADPENHVAIYTIKMAANASWTLPPAAKGLSRVLYFFKGDLLSIAEQEISPMQGVELQSEQEVTLQNGNAEARLLLLQGKPINEPVVQHGPFVMNTREEIMQAVQDYQATQFGGWPWSSQDPVHTGKPRFAKHANGKVEEPE